MEADWAAEIGPDLPVIEADWPGCIDLRSNPDALQQVSEAADDPALRQALLQLNAPASPLRTTKCDLWTLAPGEIDPLEFDCDPDAERLGIASYIDVIALDPTLFVSFERQESWAQSAAKALRRAHPIPGRVDLVVRAARAADRNGFGITLYVAGCGPDAASAQASWANALELATAVTMRTATESRASSSIG